MNKSPVFTNIGFEFFGPLYVEQSITKHGYVSPLYCSESYTLRTFGESYSKAIFRMSKNICYTSRQTGQEFIR